MFGVLSLSTYGLCRSSPLTNTGPNLANACRPMSRQTKNAHWAVGVRSSDLAGVAGPVQTELTPPRRPVTMPTTQKTITAPKTAATIELM